MTSQTFKGVTVTLDGLAATIPGAMSAMTITMQQPSSGSGVQAARIADLLERFGVNCFSQHDTSWNPWGAWPIEYTAATTIKGIQEIIGSSGYTINVRAYYFAGRETAAGGGDLIDWCPAVNTATGAKISLAIGAGGTDSDAKAMATWLGTTITPWLGWIEGVNEPNGQSPVALPVTEAAQADLPTATGATIMGPSIVIGLPHPEGWITNYLGAGGAANLAPHMAAINVHYYQSTLPSLDDGSLRSGEIGDVFVGEQTGWASHIPQIITEWHPTYYNAAGQFAGGDALAAYYAPIFMVEAYRQGFAGYFWFSLFDYSTTPCGLIAQSQSGGATVLTPKAPAQTLGNLFAICGPAGAAKHSFIPGKLDFTATGLPPPVNSDSPHTGGQTMLFQRDDGTFLLMLWNAQVPPFTSDAAGNITGVTLPGASASVSVNLPSKPSKVEHFNPAIGAAALNTWTGQSAVTVPLASEFHVLRITP
jgi:hypothetical protein